MRFFCSGSRIGHLVEDAELLLNTFTHYEVNFVGCEANFTAHNFSKLAARLGIERKWLGEIPVCISEIIWVNNLFHLFD
jgi:hypothetical protein